MAVIDDNLITNLEQVPGERTPETAINQLAKSIFERTSMAISSATKTIIPSIPKVIDDLTQKIESGSIKNMNVAFAQLESIVKKLGIDLGMYNEKLAKTLQEREERAIKSQEKVDKLREVGVIARVNRTTKDVEILTKTQIDKEKEELRLNEKKILQIEKEIEVGRKKLQDPSFFDSLSTKEKGEIRKQIETQIQTLEKTKIQAQERREVLNLQAPTGERGLELPPMLAGLKDAFMTPIMAVGDAFNQIKDQVKGVGESLMFLGRAGIRGIAKAFSLLGKIMKPIPIAIGLAIAGAIAVIYKFRDNIMSVIDFIKEIPTKVSEFLKGVFTKISDFFKSAINSVITLINKIPGVNIPLLQTSEMQQAKTEDETNGKALTISTEEKKQGIIKDADPNMAIDPYEMNTQNDVEKIIPVNYRSTGLVNRYKGSSVADRTNLNTLSKEMNDITKSARIIVNNAQQSNVSNTGTTVTSILSNKNADDTFLNINGVSI